MNTNANYTICNLRYLTLGMKYHTQMNCRNHNGKYSVGTKITSLHFIPSSSSYTPSYTPSNTTSSSPYPHNSTLPSSTSDPALLVTTCDDSIRLYSTDNYTMRTKYKGMCMYCICIYSMNTCRILCAMY